jgi:hypothetical protein
MRLRRGNYTIIAAAGLPVILGFTAMAVDGMRVQLAKAQLSQAADGIAHAALISMRDRDSAHEIRVKARKYGKTNDIFGNDVNIKSWKHMKFGFWDFETNTWTEKSAMQNAVRVTLNRDNDNRDGPLQMMLTPMMGLNYMDLQSENASIAAMRTRDTVVVVDTTGSFVNEMPDAKKAALTLLTTMRERYIPGDRVGMATFVGDGQLFTPLKDGYTEYASIYASWSGTGYPVKAGYSCTPTFSGAPQYECDGMEWGLRLGYYVSYYPYPRLVYGWYSKREYINNFAMNRGLTWCSMRGDSSYAGGHVFLSAAYSFYMDKLHWAPEMLNCGAGGGGTNQGAGIDVAIDELLVNGTVASVKSIVLISDGQPIDGNVTLWRNHFGGPSMGGHTAESFGHHQANEADSRDYSIFSVSFNDSTGYAKDKQSAYLASLTTGFGEFYETPDSTELPLILQRIAENIPIVIVQ